MKKYFKHVPFFVFFVSLGVISCSSEEINENASEFNSETKSISNIEYQLGYAQAEFFSYVYDYEKEVVEAKFTELNNQFENGNYSTLQSQAELYETIFDVPVGVTLTYLNIVETNHELISTLETSEEFNQGFIDFVDFWQGENPQAKWRFTGIFSVVAQATGAGCGGRVLAGFLDLAVSGAVAVASGGTLGWTMGVTAAGLLVTVVECS